MRLRVPRVSGWESRSWRLLSGLFLEQWRGITLYFRSFLSISLTLLSQRTPLSAAFMPPLPHPLVPPSLSLLVVTVCGRLEGAEKPWPPPPAVYRHAAALLLLCHMKLPWSTWVAFSASFSNMTNCSCSNHWHELGRIFCVRKKRDGKKKTDLK